MGGLSRLFAVGLLGSLFLVPYLVGSKGYGVGTERNATIEQQALRDCPPEMRDPVTGKCRRSHRNIMRRGIRGGGSGFGK